MTKKKAKGFRAATAQHGEVILLKKGDVVYIDEEDCDREVKLKRDGEFVVIKTKL